MIIRKAVPGDLEGLKSLLHQVCQIHADGRPDLFKAGGIKYTDRELLHILDDDLYSVFVCEDQGHILGYAFCILEQQPETTSLHSTRTLYLDDLCVDENARGRHIGSRLYDRVLQAARDLGCSRVTLHAWNFNQKAFGFYEKLGMNPLYTTMEQKL